MSDTLTAVRNAVKNGSHRDVIDFDDHVLDVSREWLVVAEE